MSRTTSQVEHRVSSAPRSEALSSVVSTRVGDSPGTPHVLDFLLLHVRQFVRVLIVLLLIALVAERN